MFRVETNKYSHPTSCAVRIHSFHDHIEDAYSASERIAPHQRWVQVRNVDTGLVVWARNGGSR